MRISCGWGIGPERRELDIVKCEWLDWDYWSAKLQFYKGRTERLGIRRRGCLRAHEYRLMLYTMLLWGLFIIAKLATICCEVWMSATEADMIGRLLVPTIALPHVCSVSRKKHGRL